MPTDSVGEGEDADGQSDGISEVAATLGLSIRDPEKGARGEDVESVPSNKDTAQHDDNDSSAMDNGVTADPSRLSSSTLAIGPASSSALLPPETVEIPGTAVVSTGDGEESTCLSSITQRPAEFYQGVDLYPSAFSLIQINNTEEEQQFFPSSGGVTSTEELSEGNDRKPAPQSATRSDNSITLNGLQDRVMAKIEKHSALSDPTWQEDGADVILTAANNDEARKGRPQRAMGTLSTLDAPTTSLRVGAPPGNRTNGSAPSVANMGVTVGQQQEGPGAYAVDGTTQSSSDGGSPASHAELSQDIDATVSQDIEEQQQRVDGLAQALAVDGVSSGPVLPVAQPLDALHPGRLRSKSTTKYLWILLVALVLIVVAITVPLTCNNTSREEDARKAAMQSLISTALEDANRLGGPRNHTLSNSGTNSDDIHYQQALQWILETDPMRLSPTADNLLQRYYLALFYFSTARYTPESGGQWKSCNPPTNPADLDSDLLCYHEYRLSLYQEGLLTGWFSEESSINVLGETGSYEEVVSTPWLTARHECHWAGLFCNSGKKVTYMHLANMNLSGTIAPELAILEDLQSLSLPFNDLRGHLPIGLSSLKNLTIIDVEDNQLSGPVPLESWLTEEGADNLKNLVHLELAYNPFDSWNLPTQLSQLSNLNSLFLQGASVTGTLPTELPGLSSLRKLNAWWKVPAWDILYDYCSSTTFFIF